MMGIRGVLKLLVAVFATSVSLSPAADPPAWVRDAGQSGPIEVLEGRPTGEVRFPAEATIRFNQPMVALAEVAAARAGLEKWVELSPAVAGSFHWLGTDTLAFRPRGGFPLSTL